MSKRTKSPATREKDRKYSLAYYAKHKAAMLEYKKEYETRPKSRALKNERNKEYNARPEVRVAKSNRAKEYNAKPEVKVANAERARRYRADSEGLRAVYDKAYRASPEGKAKRNESEKQRRKRPDVQAKQREYCARPATVEKRRGFHLQREYGITLHQWGVMFGQQEGLCAICPTVLVRGRHTHVDHCHATGKVRALLCGPCNKMLGNAQDNPGRLRAGARYIELHNRVLSQSPITDGAVLEAVSLLDSPSTQLEEAA